jgi:hypothetical protein
MLPGSIRRWVNYTLLVSWLRHRVSGKALTISICKQFYTVLTVFVSISFAIWAKWFVHCLNGWL